MNPWSLHHKLDKMIDELFGSRGGAALSGQHETSAAKNVFAPHIYISATEKEYVVSAELPGTEEKSIELETHNDILTLTARKEQENKEDRQGYYRMERRYGLFRRMLHLPEDADAAGIKASYANGVLNISIPRRETVLNAPRRIQIS